jgi:23S rRNA maturation mini-RNase III
MYQFPFTQKIHHENEREVAKRGTNLFTSLGAKAANNKNYRPYKPVA